MSADAEHYPTAVAEAVDVLRARASAGPTAWPCRRGSTPRSSTPPNTAAICCSTISARSWAARWCGRPASRAASSLSLRGGDFVFESGQDISIGYLSHDAETVRLYLEESFSFRVLEPDAAVALRSKTTKKA